MGYKKALEKNGIPFDSSLVYSCKAITFEQGVEFAKQIIEEGKGIDGIFVITDLVAVGVLAHFNEVGVKVPDDVAVIGFSNWLVSQVITPKLSTVDQPSYEMGVAAFNLLLEEIVCRKEGEVFEPKTVELGTSVVARESTKRNK